MEDDEKEKKTVTCNDNARFKLDMCGTIANSVNVSWHSKFGGTKCGIFVGNFVVFYMINF